MNQITASLVINNKQNDTVVGLKDDNSIMVLSSIENLSIEKLRTVLNNDFFKKKYNLKIKVYYQSEKIYIYSIDVLDNNLPNILKKNYVVINMINLKTQYIIPIEVNHVFNIDDSLFFGGIYNYREYDYYSIYQINDNGFNCRLDTKNINNNSIIIGYYKDDECIDYIPNRFNFNYDTLKNEISFKGVLNDYCEPGVDRLDNSSLKRKIETKIYFKYENSVWIYEKNKSNYLFW